MQARLLALYQRNKQQMKAGGPIFTACYLSMSTCSFCCIYMALNNGLIHSNGTLSHDDSPDTQQTEHKTDKADKDSSSSLKSVGVFATAMILNKALVPIKVPVSMVLTGWIMRVLKRRR